MIGIDPGTKKSAMVAYHAARGAIHAATLDNAELLRRCREMADRGELQPAAIERIRGTGRAVGRETFETCELVGMLAETWHRAGVPCRLITRHEVLHALRVPRQGGSADSRVRSRMIEILGSPGNKAQPGPTFGVAGHEWQALAVAVAALRLDSGLGSNADESR
jgi:hypothetical protein